MTLTLLIGATAPLPGSEAVSAIAKSAVHHPIYLGHEGFDGDQQADRRVHGGIEKAVHFYPRDHYADWQADLGALPILTAPGAFGENLSRAGMTEEAVAVGDVFQLGQAILQVSQGRQPCWKLNHRFGIRDMARRVQTTGRTGWYYRVLQSGIVAPGDDLRLLDRLAPDWSLRKLWHVMYVDRLNREALAQIAALDVLAEGWRRYATRRLDSGRVEDWRPRLEGTT